MVYVNSVTIRVMSYILQMSLSLSLFSGSLKNVNSQKLKKSQCPDWFAFAAASLLQAHLLDRTEDRPCWRGLHPAETGFPPRQDYNSQVGAEGRDGPTGQSPVRAHQEAGHGPAGRERQEKQRQRGALRKQTLESWIQAEEPLNNYESTTEQSIGKNKPCELLHPCFM